MSKLKQCDQTIASEDDRRNLNTWHPLVVISQGNHKSNLACVELWLEARDLQEFVLHPSHVKLQSFQAFAIGSFQTVV